MSDLIPLADAHCLPRRGSEHKLTEARVRELLPQVPEWELVEDGHAPGLFDGLSEQGAEGTEDPADAAATATSQLASNGHAKPEEHQGA